MTAFWDISGQVGRSQSCLKNIILFTQVKFMWYIIIIHIIRGTEYLRKLTVYADTCMIITHAT